jgi:hypothetical protein
MVSIPAGSSLGRYVLIEQIGRGGMATVFRAHDPNLDRHVAIKVLRSFHNEDADFVAELFGTDNAGWAGVNSAYARPPITTEQILHPEKYFSDEGPQVTIIPDISSDLGKGWVQISDNTMGEFVIRTYLEEHLDDIQAATAAEGWGGDRYSLLVGPEGERLLLSMIKWDDFQEAAEFLDIYKVYLGIKGQTTGGETNRIGDSTVSWNSAAESIFVGRSGPVILLIVGEKNETVGSALTHLEDALAAAAAAGP